MPSTPADLVLEYKIRKFAGIIGMIQAVIWMILSLICIVFYLKPTYEPKVETYIGQVGSTIYSFFLARQLVFFPTQTLAPTTFFCFMWIYVILDVAWFAVSRQMVKPRYEGYKLARETKLWSKVTFLVCFWDLVTVVILGADYNKCIHLDLNRIQWQELCANGIFPILVIAAKGFALWFTNFIFAKVLFDMSIHLQTQFGQISQGRSGQNYPNGKIATSA